MKVNFNKKALIFKLLIISFIVIFISTFLSLAIYIRKIYILNNSYEKYEKSVIAEIVSSKVTHIYGNRKNRSSYTNIVYTIHINETNETLKVTEEFSKTATYKNGEKILLNYYGIYDKHSNKYLEQQYSIKPLCYFNEGSFLGFSNTDSLFFDTNYPNNIINFKSNDFTLFVKSKEQLWIYKENEEFIGKITLNIDTTLINFISNRKSVIASTTYPLGTVYDFNYNHWHYSILNYGSNLNDSLILMSFMQENLNIMDFITE